MMINHRHGPEIEGIQVAMASLFGAHSGDQHSAMVTTATMSIANTHTTFPRTHDGLGYTPLVTLQVEEICVIYIYIHTCNYKVIVSVHSKQ